MSIQRKMKRVSLVEKLCFVLGLNEKDAQEIAKKIKVDGFEDRSHSELDPVTIESILNNPQVVEDIRLNPNKITLKQIQQIPRLKPELVETVLKGRPYYSIDELKKATDLPHNLLDDLFSIPPFRFHDKLAKKEVLFSPVYGRYITPPASEFEEQVKKAGYVQVYLPTKNFNFSIMELSNFEEEHAPHTLKAAFGGNVHPVLRDTDGFERYLVPGSIDIWFKPEIPEERRLLILDDFGLQLTDAVAQVGYYRVKLKTVPDDLNVTQKVLDIIDEVQQLDEINFAEPDYVGFEDFEMNNSIVAEDDDFEAEDRFWNHALIELAEAHLITKGSPDVTIFIIDSGCRMDHEELDSTFRGDWRNLDLNFDLNVPENVMSPHEEILSHGTKVAGVAYQIAPECRILPVKISGESLTPAYGLRAAAIRNALAYLDSNKRGVLNISWRTNGEHIGIREALLEAQNSGVAIVASAGNYEPGRSQIPDEKHYPSGYIWLYPHLTALCSVAAVIDDRKASYSYYGSKSITVAAPGGEKGDAGVAIYTTSTPDKFTYTAGTSFAAPHVTGLIALLFSVKPELTAEEAIQIIKDSADKIDDLNPTYPLGVGRINARVALEKIKPATIHTITATAAIHGTIIPSGEITVAHGADQAYTITPDSGYYIKEVLIDGHSIGPFPTHNFTNVIKSYIIEAQFASITTSLVNINLATVEELITLPYIGQWLAERIVEYRESHGPFTSILELQLVWIDPWYIEKLKLLITV